MEKILLSEIAKLFGSEFSSGEFALDICTDTRKITKDCLFVALCGENFDGHDFVDTAIANGAVAALTQRQIGENPCIIVPDTREALLKIASFYRNKFSLTLCGITGSVGKTTTKEMIALALSAEYKTLKTEGNLNNEIGLPITLFRLDESYSAAVIEMGMNHFGEIERLSKTCRPTIGVITNIGVSHIENLGSREGILKAKLEILDGMSEEATLIVNCDDDMLASVYENVPNEVINYGIDNQSSDFRAINIKTSELAGEMHTEFDVAYYGKIQHICLPCLGKHNVSNALAAFCVGICSGVEPEKIANKLSEYVPAGLRQRVEKMGEQTVIIDCYNASPDSMKAALSVLMEMTPEKDGRRVAVLADMLELGEHSKELHSQVGEMAAKMGVEVLACYGENARYIAGKADELGLHAGCATDKGMLVEYLRMKLRKNDIVLFKGSRGMRLEEVISELYGEKG